ncbi:MAG TPA: flippase [Clostridia bacterium]|uniref:PST family polysaccharide transporter n=1 Tax=Thermoanaerobacter pentosaceus TaxID=694059 RepID=A0ABT9M5P8_9THEO|nr:flippase [Thermoanaerobacter pentosaceus]MDP9751448.1 PST family polysaccharide transporter [Thermoanaerobacter pentosaceus]HHW58018.1 flippase [Clostridia bacterium]
MIEKIKNMFGSQEKRRLLENFMSLSILQVANYILPLITLPYLVRVLGPDKFGLISFAQAFIGYFSILTNYGFNLSATREISINRENQEKVSEIFSAVITIQLLLTILSFIIMTLIMFSSTKFSKDWLLYFYTFGMVVGQVLFPVWFFQGMERMKYITFLNITAKLIFTVAIFIFIHKSSSYIYVPLINSLGYLIAGVISLWIIFKDFGVKFTLPSFENIKYHLKEGWHIFISTVAISLYTISNTFILGLFTNSTIVGYYSAAEKIIRAVQGLLGPVSQTIYPYVSRLVNQSKETAIVFIKKTIILIGSFTFILSLVIFVFANLIVKILLGNQYIESVVILRIMSFLPFIIALSNIFGIQTMLTFGYKKAFSRILILASVMNVILSIILIPMYQANGTAFSVLISEIFVTVTMFIYLQKKGILVLEGKNV